MKLRGIRSLLSGWLRCRLDSSRSSLRIAEVEAFVRNAGESDLIALAPAFCDLVRRVGTEWWWMNPHIFDAFELHGVHMTQVHYYSPLPNLRELPEAVWRPGACWTSEVPLNTKDWLSFFDGVADFSSELRDIPAQPDGGFFWENVFFTGLDAITYYGICRKFKPARIIEVGAGFSTLIADMAVRRNGTGKITCIDPYPNPVLSTLCERDNVEVIPKPLQDCSQNLFGDLSGGDILFVDTSHVSRIGGELNHLLFDIVPMLPVGTMIHFHDIFLPNEYPRQWVLDRNWIFSEQYLLLAFLMYNDAYTILLPLNHLICDAEREVRSKLLDLSFGDLSGTSFWILKGTGSSQVLEVAQSPGSAYDKEANQGVS